MEDIHYCYDCDQPFSHYIAPSLHGGYVYYCKECMESLERMFSNPPPTQKELDQIAMDPIGYWKRKKRANSHPDGYRYFITFSPDPKKLEKHGLEAWKACLRKQLDKTCITSFKAAYEHKETNIHLHAIVNANRQLVKRNFKVHMTKFGFVDLKSVRYDNGMEEYITKETDILIENIVDL